VSLSGSRETRLPGDGAVIHAAVGGSGPPLLLLHGFPQTHLAWRHVAPLLAATQTVVAADLRGYGGSDAPADDAGHTAYAKRAMAADMVAAMASLGFDRFAVAGHDRGGRVAYRLALDHPERVARLAVLEIAPTAHYWRAMTADMALKVWHWPFLAQPAPVPETLLRADPAGMLAHFHRSWSRDGTLDPFADVWPAYVAAFSAPQRIAAFCADYRAGAGPDRDHDEADLAAGRRIAAPTLLIAGPRGMPVLAGGGEAGGPWRDLCADFRAVAVDCGHFPAEEAPEATAAALTDFLTEDG